MANDEDAGPAVDPAERAAAGVIAGWWRRAADRRLFLHMRDALAQAESAVAEEVLRQLCPAEAGLLCDSALLPVVRFRLAGEAFPPRVVFKVFVSRGRTSVVYMSGKRMIKPASTAAADAMRQMGRARFLEQVDADRSHQMQTRIADEVDVTSLQEYMQLASGTDNRAAALGGRDNGWRALVATEQHGVLFDFLEYLHGGTLTTRLHRAAPALADEADPEPPEVKNAIRARGAEAARQLARAQPTAAGAKARRGKEKQKRLAHMRRMYGLDESPKGGDEDGSGSVDPGRLNDLRRAKATPTTGGGDLDDEAASLFQWSQTLPDSAGDILCGL